MVNLFRRHRQPLLIVFTIFASFTFIVFYNLPATRTGGYRGDTVASLYGRGITSTTRTRLARHFTIARYLQLAELQPLIGDPRTQDEAEENFAYNTLILRHEAETLGILSATPSDAEQKALNELIFARIQALPVFQRNGGFDPTLFAAFEQNALAPNGMGEPDLEEIVTDLIRMEKVKAVVGSAVGASTADVKDYYSERFGKLEVSVVRLKLDEFKAGVTVAEDDLKKLFEERKTTLKTPEKRKVKFASWAPPKSDKPLVGSERADLMQELVSKAQDFAQAMTVKDANFDAEATKRGGTVGETPLFEPGQPPAELESSTKAAAAAFRLTPEQPNSDVVPGNNGMLVLQLAGTDPARPLAYEEAKPQLEKQLKEERAQEAMNLKGADLRKTIDAAVKAGKTFEEAAMAAGAKPEKLAPFSLADRLKNDPDAGAILGSAFEMTKGQLSEFAPTATGGLLIHLDKKVPIDLADYDKQKGALQHELEDSRREAVVRDWFKERSKAANLLMARMQG